MTKVELEIDDKFLKEPELKHPDGSILTIIINKRIFRMPIKKDDIIGLKIDNFSIKAFINELKIIEQRDDHNK